jgi:predicted transcriptional regulator
VRILEKKGYVRHVKDGRAHIYMPLVGRAEASRFEVRHLVNRFFRNSHEALVLNILEDQSIDAEELRRLRELLRASDGTQEAEAAKRPALRPALREDQ